MGLYPGVEQTVSRTTGSKAMEKWEGKDLFSPLASKSGGAFALPALQLVPPLPISYRFRDKRRFQSKVTNFSHHPVFNALSLLFLSIGF